MEIRDNIHYSFRDIDGYNKPFNLVVSAREAGKSTAFWLDKAYSKFKKGMTTLVIRRRSIGISDAYIKSIQFILNKFVGNDIVLNYKKSSIKDGVVYVYIKDKLFLCIVAISIDIDRIKSLVLPDIGLIIYDEFICNPKYQEKYVPNEVEKFQEIYNTFYRETKEMLRCYFLGNPYTMYNPYFEYFGVQTLNFKPGDIQSGVNWVVQNYRLKTELIEYILKRNPLYEVDGEYKNYALGGQNVNDANIKISGVKNGYYLYCIFTLYGDYIALWKQNDITKEGETFIATHTTSDAHNRDVYCFDFSDLSNRNLLYSRSDVSKFEQIKKAMRKNSLACEDIGIYYKLTEIYTVL